jgi:hypothetical protein
VSNYAEGIDTGKGNVGGFGTIQRIYDNNNHSFSGTALEKNFHEFRKIFSAIDGIDMDNEETETYKDPRSFVAFCKMLIGMGFGVTFCPVWQPDFWIGALVEIEKDPQTKGGVKWWNLQCYSGGSNNDPQEWADAIKEKLPSFQTNGYIVPGNSARYWDKHADQWDGCCPTKYKAQDGVCNMQDNFSGFAQKPGVGGGFIWDLDLIRGFVSAPNPGSCGCYYPEGSILLSEYVAAVRKGLGLPTQQ